MKVMDPGCQGKIGEPVGIGEDLPEGVRLGGEEFTGWKRTWRQYRGWRVAKRRQKTNTHHGRNQPSSHTTLCQIQPGYSSLAPRTGAAHLTAR